MNETPSLNLRTDTIVCELKEDTITLDAGIFTSYLWLPNGEVTQAIKVSKAGIYSVTVGNSFNCYSMDSIVVHNVCEPVIYIPNAFSPNQDGLNDYFKPVVISIMKFNMKIYNRWGELIFETDSPEPGWNGKFNDIEVQEDVYMYSISAFGIHNKTFYKAGTFTLLR